MPNIITIPGKWRRSTRDEEDYEEHVDWKITLEHTAMEESTTSIVWLFIRFKKNIGYVLSGYEISLHRCELIHRYRLRESREPLDSFLFRNLLCDSPNSMATTMFYFNGKKCYGHKSKTLLRNVFDYVCSQYAKHGVAVPEWFGGLDDGCGLSYAVYRQAIPALHHLETLIPSQPLPPAQPTN